MSDQPQLDSSASASTIIQNMQQLTDTEGDLADTAVAVAAEDLPSNGEEAGEGSSAVAADSIVQNAEAMESILEQSIPDAPPGAASDSALESDPIGDARLSPIPAALQAESAPETQFTGNDNDLPQGSSSSLNPVATSSDTSSTPLPDPAVHAAKTSGDGTAPIAEQVTDAIAIVANDIAEPILPDSVTEGDHETSSDTAIEDDPPIKTADDNVNGEQSSINEDRPLPASETPLVQPTPSASIPPPVSAAQATSSHPAAPDQASKVESVAVEPVREEVAFPSGINGASPSVTLNPDIIRDWRRDPTNGHIILALYNWSVQRSELQDARGWYGALRVDNPTATQPLLDLINLESSLSNFAAVETLFASALNGPSGGITAAADVNVWRAYLHYIRRQNPVGTGGADDEAKRKIITDAYEFALKQCGVDREAGEVWAEYIAFVQETKSKNTWETQAQQDNLRKLYQRAVCIPLNNVEALWKGYDAFESSVNKQTSKKFLAERSPAYMTARTALRELRSLTDSLPRPILPPKPTFSDQDRQLVSGWKAYLNWEEGNPLVISDVETLAGRISYSLRRCVAEMRHFPELWHYAASYYMKENKNDQAAEVLKAGVDACPKSVLLTFACAEVEEDRKNLSDAHLLFANLIDRLGKDVDELKEVIIQEVAVAKGPEIPRPQGEGMDIDGEGPQATYNRLSDEREERGKVVEERRGREVSELSTAMGIVWVMYMRFARRAEGIKAARAVFGKARKSPHVTWHIFEASALMEYHVNKDSAVAIRIFELGLKVFSEDVDYVVKYLSFLLDVNDDTNARALFERSALKIPADKGRKLWDTWARYEYMYGDLTAVHKLESRFQEVFPADSPLKRFAQRYTYSGLDQIARRDLGFGGAPRPPPPPQPQFQPGPAAPVAPPAPMHQSLPPIPPPTASDRPAHPLPLPPIPPPRVPSPGIKRPHPQSPVRPRGSIERSHSPSRDGNKRYRPNSPPPPPRRFDPRDNRSGPAPRGYGPAAGGRDRSPVVSMPPPPPQNGPGGQGYGAPPSGMRNVSGPPAMPPIPGPGPPSSYGQPPRDGWDRSGLSRGLAWFVGQLPPARSFDGPSFRPDDIMGLFSNIAPDGTRGPVPGPSQAPMYPPQQGGYPEPQRGYGGPPPPRRY